MAVGTKFAVSVVIDAVDRATMPLKKLEAQMDRTSTRMNRVSRVLSRGFSVVAKAAGAAAIAGGVAAAAAIKMGKDWLDAAGRLQDFGAQIGWNVEDIQSWRYAAGQSGVEADQFDKAIQRMSKNLAELRTGSGELYSLLTRVGDTEFLAELQNASGGDALDLIIRKMEMLENQENATLLATQAFGRSGLVMTGLAATGSPALEELRKRAYAMGIVLSQDAANAADNVSDKLVTLQQRIGGVRNRIMVAALPAIDRMVDRIDEWIDKNGDLIAVPIAEWIEKWANKIADAVPKIIGFVENMRPVFEAFLALMETTAWVLDKIIKSGKVAVDIVDWAFDVSGKREQRESQKATGQALADKMRRVVPEEERKAAVRSVLNRGIKTSDPNYWREVAMEVTARRSGAGDGASTGYMTADLMRAVQRSDRHGTLDVTVNIANLPEGSSTQTRTSGDSVGKTIVRTGIPAGVRTVGG
jgi:hypothetical protein